MLAAPSCNGDWGPGSSIRSHICSSLSVLLFLGPPCRRTEGLSLWTHTALEVTSMTLFPQRRNAESSPLQCSTTCAGTLQSTRPASPKSRHAACFLLPLFLQTQVRHTLPSNAHRPSSRFLLGACKPHFPLLLPVHPSGLHAHSCKPLFTSFSAICSTRARRSRSPKLHAPLGSNSQGKHASWT